MFTLLTWEMQACRVCYLFCLPPSVFCSAAHQPLVYRTKTCQKWIKTNNCGPFLVINQALWGTPNLRNHNFLSATSPSTQLLSLSVRLLRHLLLSYFELRGLRWDQRATDRGIVMADGSKWWKNGEWVHVHLTWWVDSWYVIFLGPTSANPAWLLSLVHMFALPDHAPG